MNLSFETGVVEYNLNGRYTVRFNPTDKNFIQRLTDAFDALENKQKSLHGVEDDTDFFRIITERDKEVRDILDALFGAGMCDAVFGEISMHALAGGLPVWLNFMLAILDVCETTFQKEQKLKEPRLAKYTKKYH